MLFFRHWRATSPHMFVYWHIYSHPIGSLVMWRQGGLWRIPRRFYGGALPYSNIRKQMAVFNPWISWKNTAKYFVSWIRLDILVNLSADSRVKFLQLLCRKGASIFLQGRIRLVRWRCDVQFNSHACTL